MSKKIVIPGRLHAGTTEQIVTGANEVYDDKRNKNQSEVTDGIYTTVNKVDNIALHHTDITDSLNSSSTLSQFSAKQVKALKGLLDAKVIDSDSISMDSEPTESNTTNIVTSDEVIKLSEIDGIKEILQLIELLVILFLKKESSSCGYCC